MNDQVADNRLVLYDYPISYNCQIVRLVLCEKGVPGHSQKVDIGPLMEHLRPWFMRINPKGVVPVLEHNGDVIAETEDIIRYIDGTLPGPSLVPSAAEDCAIMEEWLRAERSFPESDFTYGLVEQGTGKIVVKDMERRKRLIHSHMKEAPDLAEVYQQKLKMVIDWQDRLRDPEMVDRLVGTLDEMLDKLETHIGGRKFIAGPDYSLADAAWTALLGRLEMLGFKRMWSFGARPNIENYYISMKRRPSFLNAPVYLKSSLWLVIRSALIAFWPQVSIVVGIFIAIIVALRLL
ncbi:MAG: hypothetical protein CMM28_09940 [Rhodospirillaceae bacterium]|nr:hypothetical protein [Rhodospirillaceae bacterium]